MQDLRMSSSVPCVTLRQCGDSSVSIATGYGLDGRNSIPVQTDSEAHPGSYPVGTGNLSPEVKRSGREALQPPPFVREVKNVVNIPLLPYIFMVWCLIKHTNNFTFSVSTANVT
jgi:hypothetical protein